ncbi:MAG: sigma-54-dependent Fis family transcriptional regulator [Deltaproteobacteria bacterium]|nr:sigma-54-dependent Fis family transcriptional regulator [Deltaproteobacteria bacterium]
MNIGRLTEIVAQAITSEQTLAANLTRARERVEAVPADEEGWFALVVATAMTGDARVIDHAIVSARVKVSSSDALQLCVAFASWRARETRRALRSLTESPACDLRVAIAALMHPTSEDEPLRDLRLEALRGLRAEAEGRCHVPSGDHWLELAHRLRAVRQGLAVEASPVDLLVDLESALTLADRLEVDFERGLAFELRAAALAANDASDADVTAALSHAARAYLAVGAYKEAQALSPMFSRFGARASDGHVPQRLRRAIRESVAETHAIRDCVGALNDTVSAHAGPRELVGHLECLEDQVALIQRYTDQTVGVREREYRAGGMIESLIELQGTELVCQALVATVYADCQARGCLVCRWDQRVTSIVARAGASVEGAEGTVRYALDEASQLAMIVLPHERADDEDRARVRRLVAATRLALDRLALRRDVDGLREQLRLVGQTPNLQARAEGRGNTRYQLKDFVGRSPSARAAVEAAERAARTDLPVLIIGETGTGKELIAQAIHAASPRKDAPFVALNMAAIPLELFEAELFGYEAGAFTGANPRGAQGKLELAGDGTLLLDEIGDLPFVMQAKLLRAIQERRFRRVGGQKEHMFFARVIATTNVDLPTKVKNEAFRADLYYRLAGVRISLPPLRERREDIPDLVNHYIARACARLGRARVDVAAIVMQSLRARQWPGNVRELEMAIERAIAALPEHSRLWDRSGEEEHETGPTLHSVRTLSSTVDVAIRDLFVDAITRTSGDVTRMSRELGMSKVTVYAKLKRLGLTDTLEQARLERRAVQKTTQ